MPAPLAKGIIITVSVLVAAGIAVYESPQVRQWVSDSRRKIALALHNLGDEIQPREPRPQDISMTEEIGDAAKERRRKAREEIMRRGALLEARRRRKSSSSVGTFDELVDEDGNLKNPDDLDKFEEPLARSTAIGTTGSQMSHRHHEQPETGVWAEGQQQYHHELLETIDQDRLRIAVPSETSSNHPSESLVDLTPTSEFPDAELSGSGHHPEQQPLAQSEYFSIPSRRSSNNTEDMTSGFYYARPDYQTGGDNVNVQSPFADSLSYHHDVSSASSLAGSLTHIENETADTSSDGTLSDLGFPGQRVSTPASWSEVGSVVSSDDGHHH